MNELMTISDNNNAIQVPCFGQELTERFLTWIDRSPATSKSYTANLRQFLDWLQAQGITQPKREDILAYRDHLTSSGFKAGTVAAYLRNVKQLFTWTASEGIWPNVAANIRVPKVDRGKHKKDPLQPADVAAIETSITDHGQAKTAAADTATKDKAGRRQRSIEQEQRLKCMYLLAVTCGLRTIELSRANVDDMEVKGNQHYIYVWGKGRSEADQCKPVPAELAALIAEYLQTRHASVAPGAPLFTSTGNRGGGNRLPPTTISIMLKKAMKAAGYDSKRITAHSLRHTAGTAAQEITGNIYTTQEYMRHADPATTEIYLHNKTDRQQAELAEKIFKYYHGSSAAGGSDLFTGIIEKMQGMTEEQLQQMSSLATALLK